MPLPQLPIAFADDNDFRRAARQLSALIFAVAATAALLVWLQLGDLERTASSASIALLAVGGWWLAGQQPRRALVLICCGIWLVSCFAMWRFAGLRSAYLIVFPFLLALSGWVMGRGWMLGMAALTIVFLGILGTMEHAGLHPPKAPSAIPIFLFVTVGVIGITTYLTLSVFTAFERINSRLLEMNDAMLAHNTELAVRENDMEFLVNAMPVRVAITDKNGRIQIANHAMVAAWGGKIELLRNHTIDELTQRNSDPLAAPAWAKAKRGECVEFLSTIKRRDGSMIYHQAALIPKLIDGRVDIIVLVAQDITELTNANLAVRQLNENLEQRVEARTRELAQTMEHLDNARKELVNSEAKATLGAMVASITHEMGTPLGNSMMTANTLRDQVADFHQSVSSGQLRRSELEATLQSLSTGVELIGRNLERASGLLHSFKQGAADQFTEQRREFDLAETVDEILTLLRPTLKKSAHQIHLDIAPGLRFDSYPGPLGQVFINLINNAWLHAFEGMSKGELRVSAALLPDAPEQVAIVIADNGVGMSEEVQAKLFEPFFSTKIGKGGTGLGMSIVEGIVRKTLGGTLEVDSAPGKGTRYTLTVPLRPGGV